MFGSSGKKSHELLRKFYRSHKEHLLRFAWSILHDYSDAEDAVHAAFSTVLTRIETQHFSPQDARSYIYRAVHNAAVDLIRSRSREAGANRSLEFVPDSTDPCIMGMYSDLNAGFRELPDEDGRIVFMKVVIGLSFREMETILEVPRQTIATRYYRAIRILKEKLK